MSKIIIPKDDESEVDAAVENLIKHMLKHSDDSVRRTEKTLLLANCGALVLLLNAPGPDNVPFDIFWPCILFTAGIFCAGIWSVLDGFAMLGMRKLVGSAKLKGPVIKTARSTIDAKLGASVDWKAIKLDEHFPPDKMQRTMTAGFWLLLMSGTSLVVGVIWSYQIIFFR